MTPSQYRIELRNSSGVLDVRIVEDEEDIRAAVLDIAAGCPMVAGDSITVSEVATWPSSELVTDLVKAGD